PGGTNLQMRWGAARPGDAEFVPGWRNLCEVRGEHPRARRFHYSADLTARERASDGVAHHGGRGAPGERGSHHGGNSILRLRTAGQERQTARTDHGKVDCKPAR